MQNRIFVRVTLICNAKKKASQLKEGPREQTEASVRQPVSGNFSRHWANNNQFTRTCLLLKTWSTNVTQKKSRHCTLHPQHSHIVIWNTHLRQNKLRRPTIFNINTRWYLQHVEKRPAAGERVRSTWNKTLAGRSAATYDYYITIFHTWQHDSRSTMIWLLMFRKKAKALARTFLGATWIRTSSYGQTRAFEYDEETRTNGRRVSRMIPRNGVASRKGRFGDFRWRHRVTGCCLGEI